MKLIRKKLINGQALASGYKGNISSSSITDKDTSYFSWDDINTKIKSNSVLFDQRIDAIVRNSYNPVI